MKNLLNFKIFMKLFKIQFQISNFNWNFFWNFISINFKFLYWNFSSNSFIFYPETFLEILFQKILNFYTETLLEIFIFFVLKLFMKSYFNRFQIFYWNFSWNLIQISNFTEISWNFHLKSVNKRFNSYFDRFSLSFFFLLL